MMAQAYPSHPGQIPQHPQQVPQPQGTIQVTHAGGPAPHGVPFQQVYQNQLAMGNIPQQTMLLQQQQQLMAQRHRAQQMAHMTAMQGGGNPGMPGFVPNPNMMSQAIMQQQIVQRQQQQAIQQVQLHHAQAQAQAQQQAQQHAAQQHQQQQQAHAQHQQQQHMQQQQAQHQQQQQQQQAQAQAQAQAQQQQAQQQQAQQQQAQQQQQQAQQQQQQAQQQQQQQQQQQVQQQSMGGPVQGVSASAVTQGMVAHPQQAMHQIVGGMPQRPYVMAAGNPAARVFGKLPGSATLRLKEFAGQISSLDTSTNAHDIASLRRLVDTFFSSNGRIIQSFICNKTSDVKTFEISREHIPRYFRKLFDSGCKSMQLVTANTMERDVSPNVTLVEDARVHWIYWYTNGAQIVWYGQLRATMVNGFIEALQLQSTREYAEYLPRNSIIKSFDTGPDPSKPEPPKIGEQTQKLLQSVVSSYGLPIAVTQLLEVAETIAIMRDLMVFQNANPNLSPNDALQEYISQHANNNMQQQQFQQQHQLQQQQQAAVAQHHAMQQQQQQHAAMMAMQQGNPNPQQQALLQAQHQAQVHAQHQAQQQHAQQHHAQQQQLAFNMQQQGMQMAMHQQQQQQVNGGMGSPHIGMNGSPGPQHLTAPGLARQLSQQQLAVSGNTSNSSTAVASASTSPNQQNKRRRPSTAGEDKEIDKQIKQSPRVGANANKRLKQNPA